jgi:hypothetical protein
LLFSIPKTSFDFHCLFLLFSWKSQLKIRNKQGLKSLVHIAIAKEDAFFGSEFKFSMVVGVKIMPTCAPKDMKKGIV